MERLDVLKTYKIFIGGKFQELNPGDILRSKTTMENCWQTCVFLQERTLEMP